MNFIEMYLIFALFTIGCSVYIVKRALAEWDGMKLVSLKLLERVKLEGTVQIKIDYGYAKINEIKAKRVFYFTLLTSAFLLALNIILIFTYLRVR